MKVNSYNFKISTTNSKLISKVKTKKRKQRIWIRINNKKRLNRIIKNNQSKRWQGKGKKNIV